MTDYKEETLEWLAGILLFPIAVLDYIMYQFQPTWDEIVEKQRRNREDARFTDLLKRDAEERRERFISFFN